ncbi:serine/threonine protein kinase [Calothrix sp. NIES-4071]|nr:serine/threonine protein kinase [Calothrix sp. NIES-4071]BAZ56495.1 serine/threonine protein kinase [Calothrix sp. NIES-4105]
MSDPNLGRKLNKRYQLQELIGTGAMGRVYRAKDTLLGDVPVAVKFLSMSIQTNKKMRLQERFEREAKTCALLGQKSIQIVRVMDYGVDEHNTPFYVMEYLQGKSLSYIIRKQEMSLLRFLSMARQISLGLQCAHDGIPIDGKIYPIIHRDIKPSNMLVIVDPTFGELVKILDFGIAKLLQSNTQQTNYYLGTLAYSSPEQMEGKELDNRSDIYSLGVMMFEMLTSKLPLTAPTHSFGAWYKAHHFQEPRSFAEIDTNFDIPKPVEDLVMACLAKKPSDRPQNISDIIQTLAAIDITSGSGKTTTSTTNTLPHTSDTPTVVAPGLDKSSNPPNALPEEIVKLQKWPSNKPVADIVFSQPIRVNDEVIPALWMMLPIIEIQKRSVCTRYNQFLFIPSPHPMLLWVTVIYNRRFGAKWLSYYLDLKSNLGQETVRLLSEKGYYRLLFFAREQPTHPSHTLISTIASSQCRRLKEWLLLSHTLPSSANPQISKTYLKTEYEKIKPQILAKLSSINTDSPFDLSA